MKNETTQTKGETMTTTQKRRIDRYTKLLTTLERTEALLAETDISDGGAMMERTRMNIATVKAIRDQWTAGCAVR